MIKQNGRYNERQLCSTDGELPAGYAKWGDNNVFVKPIGCKQLHEIMSTHKYVDIRLCSMANDTSSYRQASNGIPYSIHAT